MNTPPSTRAKKNPFAPKTRKTDLPSAMCPKVRFAARAFKVLSPEERILRTEVLGQADSTVNVVNLGTYDSELEARDALRKEKVAFSRGWVSRITEK